MDGINSEWYEVVSWMDSITTEWYGIRWFHGWIASNLREEH